ncbi:MAG: multiheme c-type cytochrome [Pseudomonadota bacterium]
MVFNNAFAQEETASYLGVASCASSTCHGSVVEYADSTVLRNEFSTWNDVDPHSKAYATLLQPQSKLIASNLGLESAHTAKECLGCHTHNVPADLRGPDFLISDGVGCEACHGAAQNYIESHVHGTHAQNLEAGLYKTEDPLVRAEICLSCHIGNDSDRKITHAIMGAGHPRLNFELNTFSDIQPAHYRIDDDYKQRKGEQSDLQVWALGQVTAADLLLNNLTAFPHDGLFPELIHVDCLSCHDPMSDIDWQPSPFAGLTPGSMRYNDAHLLMSYQLATVVEPSIAKSLFAKMKTFLSGGASNQIPTAAIGELRDTLQALILHLKENPITPDQESLLGHQLVKSGAKLSHYSYAAAEQSAMAINSALRSLSQRQLSKRIYQDLLNDVDAMFSTLDKSEAYQAGSFIAGLRKIQARLNAFTEGDFASPSSEASR